MADNNELTIPDDKHLEDFGIFTTESITVDDGTFLTRQSFREVQLDEFDTFPNGDEIFLRTIFSAIERDTGLGLRSGWAKTPQVTAYVDYINGRRPSQPDFLIKVETANDVLSESRYRENSLANDQRQGMNKYRLSVLRAALARTGMGELITMEELEQPLRLSGDVFMSPPWRKKELNQDPFMLTLGDFTRHLRKLRIDEWFAHATFRHIGMELLDENRADSPDSHQFADELFHSSRWIDGAVGMPSLDLSASYRVVFERWLSMNQLGEGSDLTEHFRDQYDNDESAKQKRDKILQLARTAISDKVPRSWFNRKTQFAPPPRDGDFEF